jgi:hypothetical protein
VIFHGRVLLLATFLLHASLEQAVSAQTPEARVSLNLQKCGSLDVEELRTLLNIELSATHFSQEPGAPSVNVTADCDNDHVHAEVQDGLVGKLDRTLTWKGLQNNARTRLFALAIAELITTSRREYSETKRQMPSEPMPEPLAIVRSNVRQPRPHQLQIDSGVTRLGSRFSWAPTLGVSFLAPLSALKNTSFRINLDVLHSFTDLQHGEASLTSLGTSPSLRFEMGSRKVSALVEGGATLAVASAAGTTDNDLLEPQRHAALIWGPTFAIGAGLNWQAVQLGVRFASTFVVKPMSVRTTSGTNVVEESSYARILPSLSCFVAWL